MIKFEEPVQENEPDIHLQKMVHVTTFSNFLKPFIRVCMKIFDQPVQENGCRMLYHNTGLEVNKNQ